MSALTFQPEFTTCEVKGIETKAAGDLVTEVSGYFSVYENEDSHADVMKRGVFAKSVRERVPRGLVKYLDSHVMDGAHLMGTVLEAREDDSGLWVRSSVGTSPVVQEVARKVRDGIMTQGSVGFVPTNVSFVKRANADDSDPWDMIRHVHEAKLIEVSSVVLGANELTSVQAKAAAYQGLDLAPWATEWNPDAAEARVRLWAITKAGRTNWLRYGRAFAWRDPSRPEDRKGYGLPIADVVDGKLVAVPLAVVEATRAVVSGEAKGVAPEMAPVVGRQLGHYLARLHAAKGAPAPGYNGDDTHDADSATAAPPERARTGRSLEDANRRIRLAEAFATL